MQIQRFLMPYYFWKFLDMFCRMSRSNFRGKNSKISDFLTMSPLFEPTKTFVGLHYWLIDYHKKKRPCGASDDFPLVYFSGIPAETFAKQSKLHVSRPSY